MMPVRVSLALLMCAYAALLVSADDIGPPPPLPPIDECKDWNPKCPKWLKYCTDPMMKHYMENNCQETCGWCPKCEDKMGREFCLANAQGPSCLDGTMPEDCKLTCGFCTPKATPAPTTLPPYTVGPSGKCGVRKNRGSRVINGVTAKKGDWPWQVLIKFLGQPHCGGSIISPFYIVTAAHCVRGNEALTHEYKIVTGDHDFDKVDGGEMEIPAAKLIYHSNFSMQHLDKDIALIKLKWPVQFTANVGTVCLAKQGEAPKLGKKSNCFITGWGKIHRDGGMHHLLQQAKLPVVENSKCKIFNKNGTGITLTDNMLCAGYGPTKTQSGCHGDSGGPFVCRKGSQWTLHGAVSWGSTTCDTNVAYTVFARIGELRDWIDRSMKEEDEKIKEN